LNDLAKLLYWITVMPAIVAHMMPFVGRSMQAIAAAARVALSRDEMLVGTLSCKSPPGEA
jgi:hypothetical protein